MTKFFVVVVGVLLAPLFGWLLAPAIMSLPVILAILLPVAVLAVVLKRPRRPVLEPVRAELGLFAIAANTAPSDNRDADLSSAA
jgi:hypothetical protein